MHFALAALLLCVQDPDRSSPEKAALSYFKFWDELSPENWYWDMMTEIYALGSNLRTDEYNAKRKKQLEEFRVWIEDSKVLSSTYEVAGREDAKDGPAVVKVVQKQRKRKKDFESGKVEEVERSLPHRVVLHRVDKNWLILELWKYCEMCEGQGACSSCKGSGKMGDDACFACKGGKTCPSCTGQKMTKQDFTKEGVEFVLPDGDGKYSEDVSTPKAAAQAALDLTTRVAVETGLKTKALFEKVIANFRLYFVPEEIKKIEDMLARESAAGKERFKKNRPRLEAVEEKDGRATAVIVTVGGWGKFVMSPDAKEKEFRTRCVFKKAGAKWLLDEEQMPCWSCQGKGDCSTCQGTGKSGDEACMTCEGKKKCGQCHGEGWMSH